MKKKILLVDDSTQVVRSFQHILEEEGYLVATASDGIEAIAMLHEFKPDALIVDMIMPKLQGDKLCRLIRSRENLKDLFIIVLSAIAAERALDVKEFGGDVCVAKGPLHKMKPLILDLLERWQRDPDFERDSQVLGLDGVYRRSITSELLAGRHHAGVVLNNISDGIVEMTGEGRILFVNPRASFFLGRTEETLLATEFRSWFGPSAAEKLIKRMDVLPGREQEEPVDTVVTLEGRTLVINMVYLEDEYGTRIIALIKDISSYIKVENDLKQALRDKDVLLKEIHHRVKNNLAMVNSLISLEEGNISCPEDVQILEDLRSRIASISLVHDKLYRSSDTASLNLKEFIEDLVDNILTMSREPQGRLGITVDIPDMYVNIDTTIPLAIIVSELVTNALKYAFTDPDEKAGADNPVIAVGLTRNPEGGYVLEVRDNGRGFGDAFQAGGGDTLGWKLVESLSAQLRGSVSCRNDGGAVVSVNLPEDLCTG